jgi:hypothetical protein
VFAHSGHLVLESILSIPYDSGIDSYRYRLSGIFARPGPAPPCNRCECLKRAYAKDHTFCLHSTLCQGIMSQSYGRDSTVRLRFLHRDITVGEIARLAKVLSTEPSESDPTIKHSLFSRLRPDRSVSPASQSTSQVIPETHDVVNEDQLLLVQGIVLLILPPAQQCKHSVHFQALL